METIKIKLSELTNVIKNVLNEELNQSNNVWYHSSDIKNPKFEHDITPIFFSKSKQYASQYGKFVEKYMLNIKNPIDTRKQTDLNFYNEKFIPWAKKFIRDNKRYEYLKNGEPIPFTTADLLYLFLRKLKRSGTDHPYDGVLVDEGISEGDYHSGRFSIFPLSYTQIINVND